MNFRSTEHQQLIDVLLFQPMPVRYTTATTMLSRICLNHKLVEQEGAHQRISKSMSEMRAIDTRTCPENTHKAGAMKQLTMQSQYLPKSLPRETCQPMSIGFQATTTRLDCSIPRSGIRSITSSNCVTSTTPRPPHTINRSNLHFPPTYQWSVQVEP